MIGPWRRSQVVKAEVCKTSTLRFKSGRRLHTIFRVLSLFSASRVGRPVVAWAVSLPTALRERRLGDEGIW